MFGCCNKGQKSIITNTDQQQYAAMTTNSDGKKKDFSFGYYISCKYVHDYDTAVQSIKIGFGFSDYVEWILKFWIA